MSIGTVRIKKGARDGLKSKRLICAGRLRHREHDAVLATVPHD